MDKISKGELAYIPSHATLVGFDKNKKSVTKAIQTDKPAVVLVLGFDEKGYRVIFSGSEWYISKGSIYSLDLNDLKDYNYVSNINRGI